MLQYCRKKAQSSKDLLHPTRGWVPPIMSWGDF